MQAYRGYVENGLIIPVGNPVLPEKSQIIITVLDDVVIPQEQEFKVTRETFFGCMKGKAWIPDDFNEPLDDFEEYM
ncbi:MAG: DUF2281 domain-containing protein [Oscillospiraceae bacterium]|nr:DUF2281 domain-containing protein [Oscillospiraceae bacterium]